MHSDRPMAPRGVDEAEPKPTTTPSPASQDFWSRFLAERDLWFRMCARWLNGNRQDAEDAVSTGALRAHDFYNRHPGRVERFRPWMLRVLYHLCIDIRNARRKLTPLPLYGVDSEPILATAASAEVPERLVYSQEVHGVLVDEVASLPEWLHGVFTLRVIDGVPYADICRQMQITPANARQRLLQARRRLQTRLSAFR